MTASSRDTESMRMALAVLNEWMNNPETGAVSLIVDYRRERPDAVEMILGGLIPIASTLLTSLANERNVTPQHIMKEVGEFLGGLG